MSGGENLVSVIIPTFNCGPYIAQAIESVCQQGYSNLEIIVIDDGSTDDTPVIVQRLSDPRVKNFRTEQRGNYFARNRGLAEARGDFIAFLDADDVWVKDKLERQMQEFEKNPALGMCCSNYFLRYKDKEGLYAETLCSYDTSFDTASGFVDKLIRKNIVVMSTLVIRRECLAKLGPFDTAFQNAMDYEYSLRLAFNFFALYLADRLVIRLEHERNISKNKLNTFKALQYIFERRCPEIKGGQYYLPYYDELVKEKTQESQYYISLEYLKVRDYSKTFESLRKPVLPSKAVFIKIVRLAARLHLAFLVDVISCYRRFMTRQTIVKLKESEKFVGGA